MLKGEKEDQGVAVQSPHLGLRAAKRRRQTLHALTTRRLVKERIAFELARPDTVNQNTGPAADGLQRFGERATANGE
jgi:hypothetical protein